MLRKIKSGLPPKEAKYRGDKGEIEIVQILKLLGFKVRRPDWVAISPNGKILLIEVKNKEPFEPPPDYLQGFSLSQYEKDLLITTPNTPVIYIPRGKNHEWIAQTIINLKPVPKPSVVRNIEPKAWFPISQFEPLFKFLEKVRR